MAHTRSLILLCTFRCALIISVNKTPLTAILIKKNVKSSTIQIKHNICQPFPKQILESSKLKEFADDNSICDDNGRVLSKRVENTVGKGEIAHYEQFLLFPQYFQKTCTEYT